jgi:hypothetical protein
VALAETIAHAGSIWSSRCGFRYAVLGENTGNLGLLALRAELTAGR